MAIFVPRFVRQLRDVLLTAPADGEVLTYDSADEKWKNEAGGGGGGDLTDAVILAPASSARNVIQPSAGDVIAAIVKAHAAQSVDLTQWQDSAGTVLGSVGLTGAWLISPTDQLDHGLTLRAPAVSFRSMLRIEAGADPETTLIDVLTQGAADDIFYLLGTGEMFMKAQLDTAQMFHFITLFSPHLGRLLVAETAAGIFALDRAARPVIGTNTAPAAGSEADGLIAANRLAQWFDPTNGAAKWMGYGRTADGTVVTWTIPNGVVYVAGGTDVALADGGTGASTAAAARTNLGLVIGTDVASQADLDADEAALAAHLADGSDAHDASVISVADVAGDYTATDVEGVLAEIAPQLGWTTVTKAADESVASSTTTQNDDELFFTAVSGAQYEFELVIIYGSPAGGATPDLKFDIGEDATARGGFFTHGMGASDTAALAAVLCNQTSVGFFGTATADRIGKIMGVYTGAGGTFRFRWAQNTSGINATIVRAGSLLRYRLIL